MQSCCTRLQRPLGPHLDESAAEPSIHTGDVLLFQGTSALSRFIRWGSESPYSHAGLAVWWHGRLMVVQAAHRGVEVLPASTAVHRYDGQVDWWRPEGAVRAQLDVDRLVNAAFDTLGQPFAVWPLVALITRMFRGRTAGGRAGRREVAGYFCSQLVSRCYRQAGVDLVPGKADLDISPGDLARSGRLRFCGVLHAHPEGAPTLPVPALTG